MNERTEAIWARMPEWDRAIVRTAPAEQQDRWIELWAAAEANERRERARTDEHEVEADRLDEELVRRVNRGEYGKAAQEAVAEVARQTVPGATRRAFLRAARRAVAVTRKARA